MLTCVARPKQQQQQQEGPKTKSSRQPQLDRDDPDSIRHTGNTKQAAIKSLTSQLKGIALKASGAYKCNPGPTSTGPGEPGQEKAYPAYRRTVSTNSTSSPRWGKEMEARLKGLSVGKVKGDEVMVGGLTASASGRRPDPVVVVVEEDSEPKEWVAQVEPGVLITFVSLPRGGNHLKRIRFNRDMFNQWQAQKWWTDNYEKVMELYNVQRLSRHAFPLPTPPRSDDEMSKIESSIGDSPVTPPLSKESVPRNLYRGGMMMGNGMGYSSSDSFEQHSKQSHSHSQQYNESSGIASTPKLSNITAKTEASSMDESLMSTPSQDADRSGELSISNASDIETEWVEEDEPGVYITIRALPGGRRELRRVRFSREKFGEMHARVWWEENRARIHEQYL